jgi:hypothetical protein
MGNRHTTAQVRDKDRQVTVSQHETDSPVMPMAQIERLKAIHPERVEWVFEETTKEAEFRRSEIAKVNNFAFVERITGMVFGLAIALGGLYAAYRLAMAGHEAAASVVGGVGLAALVSVFIVGQRKQP